MFIGVGLASEGGFEGGAAMEDVLSFACFSIAGALLLWRLFRGRHAPPQGKHVLVASHMRSLDLK
jgi:hypothetical protein